MPLLCLAPDRPLAALPISSGMQAEIVAELVIEAIDVNPLAFLVSDPRKRLVLSVQINNLTVGL